MSKDQETSRPTKRTREGSSQTEEDEVFKDDSHGCQTCKVTNAHLADIDKKVNKLLKFIPEFEAFGNRIKDLEDENVSVSMQESLQSSQTEINKMKVLQGKVTKQQEAIELKMSMWSRGIYKTVQ